MALLTIALLLAYLVLSVWILYVLLCGKSEFHREGLVGKCSAFLTSCPSFALGILCGLCGKKVERLVSQVEECCCFSRNPFLQIVYVILSSAALFVFLIFVWPHIPNDYLSQYHIVLVPLSVAWAYATFLIACYSDPGTVTPQNEEQHRKIFEYDYLVYIPKFCPTTNVVRPARSKTCRVCNTCIAKFDHHCVWLNSDVGLNNYRYFLLFLISTSLVCFYGVYICGTVLWQTLVRDRLLSAVFVTSSGHRHKATVPILIQYMLHNYMPTIFLAIFLFAVGFAIGVFFVYHLVLACTNVTTNETFKWQQVKSNLKEIQKKLEKGEKVIFPQPRQITASSSGDVTDPHKLRQQQNLLQMVTEEKTVRNVYNRGILANLWEVIYPPSSRASFRSPKEPTTTTLPTEKKKQDRNIATATTSQLSNEQHSRRRRQQK